MRYQPVIIIGMGRSGTTILTKLLAELGLFVGNKVATGTCEAQFFQDINKWLIGSCGGSLYNPDPIRWCLEDEELKGIFADFVQFVLRTPKTVSFLGLRRFFQYRTPANLDIPWGFKDPRSTFTLPIWLEVFPHAKIIHVYRHGVDVAKSLKVGRDGIVSTIRDRMDRYGRLYRTYWACRHLPRKRELVNVRAFTLEKGFSLWEEYISEAKQHVASMSGAAFEVQFEHLMSEPKSVLRNVAEFCHLEFQQKTLDIAIKNIKRDRAFAYRSDPEAQSIAESFSERLSLYGY